MSMLMRESGFSALSGTVACVAHAPAIDFAILLTAGSFSVPGGFAMNVPFEGWRSAVFFVAELTAAGTVFFAVRDFTAVLCEILCESLFIADFEAVRVPVSLFIALTLAVPPNWRVVFATFALLAYFCKHDMDFSIKSHFGEKAIRQVLPTIFIECH